MYERLGKSSIYGLKFIDIWVTDSFLLARIRMTGKYMYVFLALAGCRLPNSRLVHPCTFFKRLFKNNFDTYSIIHLGMLSI